MADHNKLILNKCFARSYAFLAWLGLLGVLLIVFIFMLPNIYGMAYVSGIILILLCSFPFLYSFVITKDYLEIINFFVAWFAMSMGLKGLISLQYGSSWLTQYPVQAIFYQNIFLEVFLYSILGLLSLYVGYYIGIAKKLALLLPSFKAKSLDSRKKMGVLMLIFIIIASVGLYFFYINEVANKYESTYYVPSTIIKIGILQGGKLYYSLFVNFAPAGLVLLYSYYVKRKFGLIEIAIGFIFLSLVLIYFLFIGMKVIILYLALSLIITYHYIYKRFKYYKLVFYGLLLVLLMPILQFYRMGGLVKNGKFDSFFDLIINRSAGADMFFLALDKTPYPNPFLYGKTMLKIFTAIVPRKLWLDKPWSFGRDFGQSYIDDIAFSASCISPSTIGEWYINFGIIGVVIGFFIFGIILRTIYVYCIEKGTTRINVAIYAIIFPITITMVDGPITEYVVFTAMALFPVFIFLILDRILFNYGKNYKNSNR